MNIKILEFYNYKSHKNTSLNFDQKFYNIIGKIKDSTKSNGSGKSTIAEVIGYCYFGDSITDCKNDDLIHNDEKNMGVMASFELNDINYVIKRKVTRGSSPTIYVKVGDAEEIKYGVKAGQEIINDILEADFSIYKNTSYFKQGDINSFSTLTPKEAKEVVIKILQLGVYNQYEAVAKEKSKEAEAEILKISYEMDSLETQITNAEQEDTKPKVSDSDLIKLTSTLSDMQIKKLEAQTVMDGKGASLEEVTKKADHIKGLMSKTKFKLDELKRRIEKLQKLSGKCPTCEHELNEVIKKSIILNIKKETIPLASEIDLFNDELEKVKVEETGVRAITVDTYNYASDISTLNYKIGEAKAQLKQIKEAEDTVEKMKVQRETLSKALDGFKATQKQYNALQKAFGKKGIQAYIIENVIPEIQATTNDILAGLDTGIRINIDSQKELKKGGKAETLDISVITPFGERPYTNYSGGEKTFIDFALRIALSIILTRRSDCKIQTLILDEVWGQLDSVNRGLASNALRHIANKYDFKKILIISHQEELQDAFPNTIMVEFDGIESKVTQNEKEMY